MIPMGMKHTSVGCLRRPLMVVARTSFSREVSGWADGFRCGGKAGGVAGFPEGGAFGRAMGVDGADEDEEDAEDEAAVGVGHAGSEHKLR